MSIDAALIQEAVRVQRARTLLDVRDAIDKIAIDAPPSRGTYRRDNRTAKQFRDDVLDALKSLEDPS